MSLFLDFNLVAKHVEYEVLFPVGFADVVLGESRYVVVVVCYILSDYHRAEASILSDYKHRT